MFRAGFYDLHRISLLILIYSTAHSGLSRTSTQVWSTPSSLHIYSTDDNYCHHKTQKTLKNLQTIIAFAVRWRTCPPAVSRCRCDALPEKEGEREGTRCRREVVYDEGAAGLALARSLYTSRPPLPLTSLPVLPASCHPRISLHPLPPNRTFPPMTSRLVFARQLPGRE